MEEKIIDKLRNATGATHVIFSSHLDSTQVMNQLVALGIQFKVFLGKYKDTLETSYMIAFDKFEALCTQSNIVDTQESVMLCGNQQKDGTREAFLLFNTPEFTKESIKHIGFVTPLTPEEAAQQEAWSYDPLLGVHFGCLTREQINARAA